MSQISFDQQLELAEQLESELVKPQLDQKENHKIKFEKWLNERYDAKKNFIRVKKKKMSTTFMIY